MITLYWHPMSPNSKRILVAAKELNIELDTRMIDLPGGEQHTDDFLSKNPYGRVPVIEIDGDYLWESPAILYRLASEYREAQLLLPDSEAEVAEMLKWMFWHANHQEPAINAIVFEKLYRKPLTGKEPVQEKIDENMPLFERCTKVLDDHLQNKQWLMGDMFTIADICVGTSMEMAQNAGISFDALPGIRQWLQRLTNRPGWNVN
ncbi:glutathione S-transferase family protein [Sedimenticola sp.]|uniref:glutathione S-transferase family protein n=1 Tax=Sedimenticola sp. TaxID=1940285 RepID=UPI003D0D5109